MKLKKAATGISTGAIAAMIVFAGALPASAATASCKAENATSSLSHTVTELPSDTCNLVQARAVRYHPGGATETVYGPQHHNSSSVSAYPGVAISNWAGRAKPVGDPGPWAGYQSYTTTNQTKTFTVTF